MLDPYTQTWNGKWEKVYEDSHICGFSGKSIDKNDMPNLNMGTMSYCFSVNPIEVFFWDNNAKKWYDENNNEVHQLWQD